MFGTTDNADGGHRPVYIRRSANPCARAPWQIRRNRPDQTYDVLGHYATYDDAYAAMVRDFSDLLASR